MTTNQQAIQPKPEITPSTTKQFLDDEKDRQIILSWKPFLVVISVVFIAQVIFTLAVMMSPLSWPDSSAFGEMFGGLNTLFSGLAFAGVIYAILLQRRELRLQRLELELTRNELQRAAAAQEKSEQALKDQIEELAHQRRLSIMPGVILCFQHPADDAPTVMNSGNGVALNVRFEPIPLTGKWKYYCVYLNPLSYIFPNQPIISGLQYLSYMSTEQAYDTVIYQDPEARQYLRAGEYEVIITFNDIEGNQYTQKVTMSAGQCRPQKVKLI
jgi:hypothetical protein